MDVVDRDTLLRLADRNGWPSATIYLPLDRLGIHTDADRIRLRNLIKVAHEHLLGDGLREADATAMLANAADLLSDDSAWSGGPSGLAIFVQPATTETVWTSEPVPELALVGDRFYVRPLFATRLEGTHAWALAIDSNHTRLFRLSRDSVEEVQLPEGTPVAVADISKYVVREEELMFHTMPGGGAPGGTVMFHGQGGEKDVDKVEREQFLDALSRGVVEVVGAESADPLVLLGVDYLVNDFRAMSAYSHIAPEHVEGATDYLSPQDVQKRVLAALAPRAKAAAMADVAEFQALAGTGRATQDAGEIVAAAAAGRVKMLLMDDSQGPWGYFDRETFDVTRLCPIAPRYLRDTADAGVDIDVLECGWDLIDLAAVETLRHGGTVRAFRGDDAPVKGAAAVLRY